jgi:hypothetical protein
MIADQVAVELGAAGMPRTLFTEVQLDSILAPRPGLVLWRGTATDVSHTNPYIVATVPNSSAPLRLGGFPSPNIEAFATALDGKVANVAAAKQRARLFSVAVDPNGAVEVAARGEAGVSNSKIAGLLNRLPEHWPSDTTWSDNRSIYFIRQTVLSRNAWIGYSEYWVPISYSFLIDSDGHLLAWQSYIGELKKAP